MPLQTIGTIIVAGLVIFLAITLFRRPLGCLLRILLNTVGGFILLFILNYLGQFIGISIGINWVNAVIVGILGLPGVGLLLILQWLLVI
ncbi:MAG: pro-sigmaK processing inhibitor BofA family protein [Oscillospiraceae bacterium]|nr:pro-sigmaK processing inhibitor BofA family protein [Oscillospiraceae bacterium]